MEEAERIMETHAAIFKQVEEFRPNHVYMYTSSGMSFFRSCPGKYNIIIIFDSRSDRDAIEGIIGDDKFFLGIPYSFLKG